MTPELPEIPLVPPQEQLYRPRTTHFYECLNSAAGAEDVGETAGVRIGGRQACYRELTRPGNEEAEISPLLVEVVKWPMADENSIWAME